MRVDNDLNDIVEYNDESIILSSDNVHDQDDVHDQDNEVKVMEVKPYLPWQK